MIESVGPPTDSVATRIESNVAAENKNVDFDKLEKTVEERVIESTQEGTELFGEKDSGFNKDKNGIFFEKYDKKGNVLFRIPSEQRPVDEHV